MRDDPAFHESPAALWVRLNKAKGQIPVFMPSPIGIEHGPRGCFYWWETLFHWTATAHLKLGFPSL